MPARTPSHAAVAGAKKQPTQGAGADAIAAGQAALRVSEMISTSWLTTV